MAPDEAARPQSVVGIQVGASKEAIIAARNGILDILQSHREDKTIRAALGAFVSVCGVSGTTITGGTIGPLVTYASPRDEPE